MIFSIRLLTVHLIVVSDLPVKRVKIDCVCDSDGRSGDRPPLLQKLKAIFSPIEEGAHCHHGWDSGDQRSEASLRLPDAEPLMIVEQIW